MKDSQNTTFIDTVMATQSSTSINMQLSSQPYYESEEIDIETVDPSGSSVILCPPLSVENIVNKSTQLQKGEFMQQSNDNPRLCQQPCQQTGHPHLLLNYESCDISQVSPSELCVPKTPVNGGDVIFLVPGRLSLLNAIRKYKVSVDEVRRRLSSPECLNMSLLGSILRRAKSKNGGHYLRQTLEEKGISLPLGRRKETKVTLFTSLVEEEALHLAYDHRTICLRFFPHYELAQIIGQRHANSAQIQDKWRMVEGARELLSEFQAMVDEVGQPSNLSPNNSCNGLTKFNLISHGFGSPSISTAVTVILNYLLELSQVYEMLSPSPDAANLVTSQ